MVAGARLAREAGWEVRGSDTELYPPASDMVAALGVPVARGYDAANLDWGPDVVVIGNVLSRGNPEVEAALSKHMHYMSLPEWLKEYVLRCRRPVVVAGTHGKTTTTALTAHVLNCGADNAGYLIGGETLGFQHSARLGEAGAPFVIEGDEYDTAFFDKRAKFFHYLPDIAIVTSIEFDHGDIYPDLAAIETAFQRMLRQMPREGRLFLCGDNRAASLAAHAFCTVERYGFSEDADWRGVWRADPNAGARLEVSCRGRRWGDVAPTLAGNHNALNTLAAIAAAAALDMDAGTIADAIASFKGVRRRMEVFLEANGTTFMDDFAHHPTAVGETIAAVKMRWPKRRLRAVFEPRSNTTVTNRFQQELGAALALADEVLIGPIHRPENIAPEQRLDRAAMVGMLAQQGIFAQYHDNIKELANVIVERTVPGDVVLFMSNGAFGGIYNQVRDMVMAGADADTKHPAES